jgi:hypothetical protein
MQTVFGSLRPFFGTSSEDARLSGRVEPAWHGSNLPF